VVWIMELQASRFAKAHSLSILSSCIQVILFEPAVKSRCFPPAPNRIKRAGSGLARERALLFFCLRVLSVGCVGCATDGTHKILYKKQKKAEKKDSDNIYRFKPILYLSIILLAVILSITIARPFIAQTYWYKGFKEIEKENWKAKDNAHVRAAVKKDKVYSSVGFDR